MATSDPCATELQAAYACIQMTACDCFDVNTFLTDFEGKQRQGFMGTQAFTIPTDPAFCDMANDKVCEFYSVNQACCCQAETEVLTQCLVEKKFSPEVGVQCDSNCNKSGGGGGGGGGGGSTTIIIAVVAVVALLVAAIGRYLFMRRRQLVSTHDPEDNDDISITKRTWRSFLPAFGSSTNKEKVEKKKILGDNSDIESGDSSHNSTYSYNSDSDEESANKSKKKGGPRTERKPKKQGSQRSVDDFEDEYDSNDKKSRTSKSSKSSCPPTDVVIAGNMEMDGLIGQYQKQIEKLKKEKEASKHQLDKMAEERTRSSTRLSQLEESRGYYEGRLRAAEMETEKLRQEHIEAARRIAELEAENQLLNTGGVTKTEIKRSSSKTNIEQSPKSPKMRRSSSRNGIESGMRRQSSRSRLLEDDDDDNTSRSSRTPRSHRKRIQDPSELVKRCQDVDERLMERYTTKKSSSRNKLGRPSSSRDLSSSRDDEARTTSWNHKSLSDLQCLT